MKNMFVFKALLFSAVALGVSVLTGWAGDSAWSVDSNGNWSDVGNWDNGVPGSVSVDTLDMATFANVLSADRVVAVDDERHIGGITFGTEGAFGFTLTGGSLLLMTGGEILNTTVCGAHADIVNSPIVLRGNSGSAFISANSDVPGSSLVISGNISGSAAVGQTTVLYLRGAGNELMNQNLISGAISDGSNGGALMVVKSGTTNLWVLGGANTFSGGVSIQQGVLVAAHDNALGSGAITQSAGAGLALLGNVNITDKNITLGGSTSSTMGSLDNLGGTNTWGGDISCASAGPRINVMTGKLVINGNITLNHISGNTTLGGFGLGEIHGVISGAANKTLYRSSTDSGTWVLCATNTYAGPTAIGAGVVAITSDRSLGAVRSTLSTSAVTFGNASNTGTLRAMNDITLSKNYGFRIRGGGRFDVDDGKTLTCNGPIGYPIATDWGKLAKIGAGTLVLGGSNNFTNWFEVLEGKVVLANANAFVGKNGVKPPVRVEAVLDLGDLSFSIPKLAGADGVISNGVVTVENATTLGDDGKCAPLAFFGDLNLTGSLNMDVAADGASDQLRVTGDLNLNNVDLQLADVGELSKTHEYTLISVTDGALNGRFVSDNLPDNWYLVYLSNEIHLKYTTGLNVILH